MINYAYQYTVVNAKITKIKPYDLKCLFLGAFGFKNKYQKISNSFQVFMKEINFIFITNRF